MIADRVQSITTQIAINAARSPRSLAVTDESTSLTYSELEQQSDILTARIRQAGAGPNLCVAIVCERSAQFVMTALAVMKSGAAYLPLDPALPTARINSILVDAKPLAIIDTSRQAQLLLPGTWQNIVFDQEGPMMGAHDPLPDVNPCDLAYVIYTSGSTGEPKGVEIEHENLRALIRWHETAFDLISTDRVSQVASVGFDAAVWEIWPTLMSGASLHIPNDATRRSWQSLLDWIVTEKITVSFVPTPLAEPMIRAHWPKETALRYLLTGGDTLRSRPSAELPFKVVNNYGPTECTVVATSGPVPPQGNGVLPSIGRPIAGARIHILDEALEPVAPGAAGEVFISGSLVGRGYRNRPDITAMRFIALTNGDSKMTRAYRTGDRARLLDNGEIAFLGRLDDQVKIRGYRIELGEVDAAVSRLKGIVSSTIAVREVGSGGPALVAYIVAEGEAPKSAAEFQQALASQLAEYMVPAYFVSVPFIPMTTNGKPDRSALPEPSIENLLPLAPLIHESTPQGSLVLDRLPALVSSLVGQSVGLDENFFLAGGHSMLGVELVARIRDTFGVRLTLRQLFESPTVRRLASEIAQLSK
jgi:amino acid adenylation domain-containing protein